MSYEHGGDIYTNEYRLDFSTNINPFGVSREVKRAAVDAMNRVSAYPDSQSGRLKGALAEKLGIPSKWLIVGNGAADLIFSLVLAEKPKKAMILAPAFLEYEQALKSIGCQVAVYDRPEEQAFVVDERFLLRLETELGKGLDMVFLCSPDNPTGAVIRKDILVQTLKLCDHYGARMVVDESFYEFAFVSETETMLPQLSEETALCILRSFTKMYGMPGLRLGYGICRDRRLIEDMEAVRQPWSVSIPAQEAGIAALHQPEWAEKVRRYVQEQRTWLEGELANLDFKVYPSQANYILFYGNVELMEPLKEKGILIRDCSNYRNLTKGYYRIAVKKEEENRQLIQTLREICPKGR